MVSIIIATYNRATYIAETLEAIAGQTYRDFECIIVDDGSTDHTAQMVTPFVEKDSRFKYVLRPDTVAKGANHSRNYGYTLSSGRYIKFFDSDDLMLPAHLEVSVIALEKGNFDFVVADCINFDESGTLDRPYEIDRKLAPLTALHFAQWKTAWITNDLLVKREFADQLEYRGGIRDQASEYQYNIKLLLLTENGLLLDDILTHRRIHEDGFVVKATKNQMYFDRMNAELYFVTAQYVKHIATKPLLRWLLSSHVILSFKIATSRIWPENVGGATKLLFRVNGPKALLYPFVTLLGFLTGKGYVLSRYVRT